MCAIFGFVNYRCSLNRSEMKELINRLSVESEVRGKDATGIAYVKHGELKVFKRAKPAHKVKLYVPEDTVILTGHTRMTTQGDARYIYNNHPFTGKTADGSFALCHNGVLYNDSQLAKSERLPKSKIETDHSKDVRGSRRLVRVHDTQRQKQAFHFKGRQSAMPYPLQAIGTVCVHVY